MEAKMSKTTTHCYEFEVNGMHCAACELLIEDKLSEVKGVKSVQASLSSKKVKVEVDNEKDEKALAEQFTELVKNDGYEIKSRLETLNSERITHNAKHLEDFIYAVPIAIIFLLAFSILQTSGILSTGSTSDLVQTFILGIIASLSSCMALIGGLVLALSNKYSEAGATRSATAQISFHLGRIVSFFILGGVLGVVGSILKPTPTFTLILTLIVSAIMINLGVSQMGIFKSSGRFQLKMPKSISRRILNLQNLNYSFIPLLLGALTFFLPCGFTLAVQGVALDKGDFIQSALTMLAFALGTFPVLGLLSFASVNFAGKLKSGIFLKTTGIIIIAFAIYNVYGALIANGII